MPADLLIADLHLSPQRPAGIALFLRFLEQRAAGAARLFILGDLFDAWIGDDNRIPPVLEILAALRRLSDGGTGLLLMRGNRDFLIGGAFAAATGCTLLEDPTVVELGGVATLLMHGDLLCSDDIEYQQARRMLRDPAFIADFLSKPIEQRVALAAEYRKRSGEAVSTKAADIMDVNPQTVRRFMRDHGVTRLIHGHTHRPAVHRFDLDGRRVERHVLDQWHERRGGYLEVVDGEVRSMAFE